MTFVHHGHLLKMGFGLSKRRSSQSSAGMRPDSLRRLRAHARCEQYARFRDLVKLQLPNESKWRLLPATRGPSDVSSLWRNYASKFLIDKLAQNLGRRAPGGACRRPWHSSPNHEAASERYGALPRVALPQRRRPRCVGQPRSVVTSGVLPCSLS